MLEIGKLYVIPWRVTGFQDRKPLEKGRDIHCGEIVVVLECHLSDRWVSDTNLVVPSWNIKVITSDSQVLWIRGEPSCDDWKLAK
jgi:hypothetical protein